MTPSGASPPGISAAERDLPHPASSWCGAARALSPAQILGAAAGGLSIAASFLDFRLFPLAWIAFTPVLLVLRAGGGRRETILLGLITGLATNIPAFHWLVYTIAVFGGFPWLIAAFFYLCLSVYSAGQFVLFALAVRRTGPGPLCLAPAAAWVALELLYPNLFPWRLANSQLRVIPLLQIGELTGPFGLSFVMVWFASGLSEALRSHRLGGLLTATCAAAAVTGWGLWRLPAIDAMTAAAPALRVALVQGNLSIEEKGNAAFFEVNLARYQALSAQVEDRVDLLVWPETVSQEWVEHGALQLVGHQHPYPQGRKPLLFGGLSYRYRPDGTPEKFNSAFLVDPVGRILGRYDKRILLPFGEYLPGASLIPALAALSPQTGDFTPGRIMEPLDLPGRVRLGPLICYEDVPAEIARTMTRRGAQVLVTIFNDAWFGRSAAPYQHEALAAWRAVENRRFFLRAGNAGATGIVDPAGRVLTHTALFTEEALEGTVRPIDLETFYTRHGDVFAWCTTLLAAVLLVRRPRHP